MNQGDPTLQGVTQRNQLLEVLRCRTAAKQWRRLTAAYLGLASCLPFSIDLATGPFEFREISDVPTFWQIFHRGYLGSSAGLPNHYRRWRQHAAFSLDALLRAPLCHVIAVEPAPDSCHRMLASCFAMGLRNAAPFIKPALGGMAGTTMIQISLRSQPFVRVAASRVSEFR